MLTKEGASVEAKTLRIIGNLNSEPRSDAQRTQHVRSCPSMTSSTATTIPKCVFFGNVQTATPGTQLPPPIISRSRINSRFSTTDLLHSKVLHIGFPKTQACTF